MTVFKRSGVALAIMAMVCTGVVASGGSLASARIDGDGAEIVVDTTTTLRYDIAYNPDRDEYLGIYQPQDPGVTSGSWYALRFDADGTPMGSPVLAFAAGSGDTQLRAGFFEGDVTYNPTTEEYLLVALRAANPARQHVVVGRRFSATGSPIGSEQAITPALGNFLFCSPLQPDATYDATTGGYKLVYTRWWATTSDGPGASCGAALTPNQSVPVLQALSADLAIGSSIDVGSPIAGSQRAGIASNPVTGDIMVTRVTGTLSGSASVFSSSLTLKKTSTITDTQDGSRGAFVRPEPAADPITGNYLVTSHRAFGVTTATVFDSSGAQLSQFNLPFGRATEAAAVGDGTYLATGSGYLVQIGADGHQMHRSDTLGSFVLPVGLAVDSAADPRRAIVFGPSGASSKPSVAVREIVSPGTLPLVPARVLDTRTTPNAETVDGEFLGAGPRPAGSTLTLDVWARGGVPVGADAVLLNVAAAGATERGFVTAFPCDAPVRPNTSSVNFEAGAAGSSGVFAKVSATGTVCLFVSSRINLIADVNGYVPAFGSVTPVVPARLMDTRPAGQGTVDGRYAKTGPVAAGSTTKLDVTLRGGVPSDADAVLINVTAVNPVARTYVTAYPCGEDQPETANLNVDAGAAVNNLALAKVGSASQVCLFSSSATDLIVDVVGYVPIGSGLTPIVPARVYESRTVPTAVTVDGMLQKTGRRTAGSRTTIAVVNRGGVPADARGVFLNVAVVNSATNGFATVYPCDKEQPETASVNYASGAVVSNAVFVQLSASGTFCVFTSAEIDLVIDVVGHVVDA